MSTLVINNHYNFSLYANSVLGSSYKGFRLSSILDYNVAVKFGNIDLLHRQVYPYLPPGTPKDHTKYTYFLFQSDNKQLVVAQEWIIPSSIEQTVGRDYTITIRNSTDAQVAIVRDQLRLLGLTFDIL